MFIKGRDRRTFEALSISLGKSSLKSEKEQKHIISPEIIAVSVQGEDDERVRTRSRGREGG